MIDLRSDTVTLPTPAMRRTIHDAEVGDDVMGEDPTVRKLESMLAAKLGKAAALFTPSATQSNLIALLTHCGRGDEAIVGQQAHNYLFEAGGAAVLGGIQPQPLNQEPDGTLDLTKVEALIKPDDFHFARSRLLCLENTTWGKVLPAGYCGQARELADRHGLKMHLDGARIFNASVASNTPAADLAEAFDSVTVCLSKGLGAPVGSVLVADAGFIQRALRWRKMLGGGMRQSGLLAAAGIYALENHIDRLADDHSNARNLANGLAALQHPALIVEPAQSNMVHLSAGSRSKELRAFLTSRQILTSSYSVGGLRLVTHLGVSADDIPTVLGAFGDFFEGSDGKPDT